jgi:hypothetical protein
MSDYENMLAEWGMSMYDTNNIGLHHRIRRVNEIDAKKEELKNIQSYYDQYKMCVESNWTTKNFQVYIDASWNLKMCKEELAALMSQ